MLLSSETKRDEVVRRLGEFIAAKQQLEALYGQRGEREEALSSAEWRAQAAGASDLAQRATEIEQRFFLGEASLEQVAGVKREFEQAKIVSGQHEERLSTLREAVRETETAIEQTRSQIQSLQLSLKVSLPAAFNEHFDRERLWKSRREGDLQWRKLAFLRLYHHVHDHRDGVEALSLFAALQAFFSDTPFQVRVVKGFRYTVPVENGPGHTLIYNKSEELVSVPSAMSFEIAFEEICNGRAVFVPGQ